MCNWKMSSIQDWNLVSIESLEKGIPYSIVYNKKLNFAKLFLDQMIHYFTRNKKRLNAPYQCWLGLILSCKEGYIESHGIIIPIPALSSKIINVAPSQNDLQITVRMQKWIEKPYVVDSSDHEEDNNNDDADYEEDNDNNSEADNKEGANGRRHR